jgi:hypothetical protein
MQKKNPGLLAATAVLLVIGLIAGCATILQDQILETERLLTAAGFKPVLADTSSKRTNLEALPQQTLLRTQQGRATYYLYADAAICRCLYYGNLNAYLSYERMGLARGISREQLAATQIDGNAVDWIAWGNLR